MAEPLTLDTMLDLLPKLYVAFPRTLGKEQVRQTAVVYRDGLRGLTGDGVRAAVDRVIREDTFFPKVARLRELARDWEKVNVAMIAPQTTDPLWCPRCRNRCTWRALWRPRLEQPIDQTKPAKFIALTLDRSAILLERVERLACDCAVPSPYMPSETNDPDAPAQMAISALPDATRRRIATERNALTNLVKPRGRSLRDCRTKSLPTASAITDVVQEVAP